MWCVGVAVTLHGTKKCRKYFASFFFFFFDERKGGGAGAGAGATICD